MFIDKKNLTHFWSKYWPFLVGAFIYLSFVSTNIFTGHHTFFNLEPYPDGLWYVGEGLSLAQGKGLALHYEQITLDGRVPPIYPVILAPVFLLSKNPAMFYATNILLGLMTLFTLFCIVRRWTKNQWLRLAPLLVYIFHGFILWVVGVPMAENVSVFFFCLCIWILFSPKISFKKIVVFMLTLLALLLTKYAYIFSALAFGLLLLTQLFRKKQHKEIGALFGLGIFGAVLMALWFFVHHANPFDMFTSKTFGVSTVSGTLYYSFIYVQRNGVFYLTSLLGKKSQFLWLQQPLTSPFVAAAFFIGLVVSIWKKTFRFEALALFILLISQFPLLLIFYVADARYFIFSIPIYALGTFFAIQFLWQIKKWKTAWRWGIVLLFLGLHLFWQTSFFRQIIGTNWFQRSRAWQYEAVRVFDQYFQQFPSSQQQSMYLITALPPFFVRFYELGSYHLLPLSANQEFANKKQYVWGGFIDYQNLSMTYVKLLKEGKVLYISNSYLTAQHEFLDQYQTLRGQFQLNLVAHGCAETCNIYQVTLADTQMPPRGK